MTWLSGFGDGVRSGLERSFESFSGSGDDIIPALNMDAWIPIFSDDWLENQRGDGQ
jgi:hypothetical protein